ncbi:hypothetical protein Anacy_4358 [Anabaena cylindrica PCC 7122]|uniref:Uncharacterized protein n=1 Tax=Anabaena cylindrica (strain ATCC 27899 / PCC 7122) TaxID=272123 RepID=K9ZN44_ANACC|nr:hypothetical protein Anacy_4358 [Anabaena cylindrica PCC 7122]BAY03232.1 hypothetical protein NIES19_24840 [Anabaena cylindrica PCC 7122]
MQAVLYLNSGKGRSNKMSTKLTPSHSAGGFAVSI